MTEHGTSGRDLARLALAQYKASPAGRQQPTSRRKPTRRRADAGSGRDPQTFAAILNQLNTDREWGIGVQGGNILDQWPTLCPDLATTVQPIHYDADTGRLDLRPASHAYAAQLRLSGPQLAQRINGQLGSTAVRTIRVLAPGPVTPPTAAAAPAPAARAEEPPPVRTRDDAAPGYHRARAAISHTPPTGQKPRIERDWGTGEYGHLREPEHAFTDAVAALETAEASKGNDPASVRQAALKRARAEKAGRAPAVPTAFLRSA
ncbi:DciA family protein [Streptomyces sp. NPDC021098]|uniref:DciA family protein n=1 Tax=unclassified Streptomyces TaxID=2593676 RepID=UPI003794F0AA